MLRKLNYYWHWLKSVNKEWDAVAAIGSFALFLFVLTVIIIAVVTAEPASVVDSR